MDKTYDEIRQIVSLSETEDITLYIWKLKCRIFTLEYLNSLRLKCRDCRRRERFYRKRALEARSIWKMIGEWHRQDHEHDMAMIEKDKKGVANET